MDPLKFFASDHYRRHNSRRLEHLAARFADRRPPGPRIGRQVSATRPCRPTQLGLGSRMAATRGRAHRRAADLESVNQWKSARTTNAIERLHEKLKHRIKTPASAAIGRDR